MVNTRTSYHNHTTWSDGVSTVGEMIEGAHRAGLDEIGISDHFALAPDRNRFKWAMAPESLDEYVNQIQVAAKNAGDLKVRLGLEVDYFPETIKATGELLSQYPFDFLIASVHFVDGFPVDLDPRAWEIISQDNRNQIWKKYWHNLQAIVESGLYDFVAHFDLPKKFNFHPTIDLVEDALKVQDSIAAHDMAIEINTSGWDKPAAEAYPSLFFLKEAKRRSIPLLINADAHNADNVARNFDRARSLAADAGYTETVRYEKRNRFSIPL
jgi:histidinol-phosphatase (PHP family)